MHLGVYVDLFNTFVTSSLHRRHICDPGLTTSNDSTSVHCTANTVEHLKTPNAALPFFSFTETIILYNY